MKLIPHPNYSFSIESLDIDSRKDPFYLLFYPIIGKDFVEEYHDMYLINRTMSNYLYDCSLDHRNSVLWRERGIVEDLSISYIGRLSCSWLNERPQLITRLTEKKTDGTGDSIESKLILKPKLYPKKAVFIETNKPVYFFEFPSFEKSSLPKKKEEVLDIVSKKTNFGIQEKYDSYYYLTLPSSIDLHTENLDINTKDLDAKQILSIQLTTFEEYIENALIANLDYVYVIHGIGKGKLREMIHQKLKEIPEVSSFINEYHPKYGWGATQVFFK